MGVSTAILLMLGCGDGTTAYLNYCFDESEGQVYSDEVFKKNPEKKMMQVRTI